MTRDTHPNLSPIQPRVAALSPHQLPAEQVELLQDATVLPMTDRKLMPCGVYRADGSFCQNSRTLISKNRFTAIPDPVPDDQIAPVDGQYLFAGLGRHHFGHFLMECIGRLWAMESYHSQVDGILVLPMYDMNIEAVTRRRFLKFYHLLSYDTPLFLVEHPARIEKLLMPSPAFGHLNWSVGTPKFRQFIRQRLAGRLKPEGPEKLYISRSRLKSPTQQVDQEDRIEEVMTAAGYEIFHPQKHSVEVQCQRYMAARQIVGGDGSAFHLAPFVMASGTRVGLIKRRRREETFQSLVNQINAFSEVDLHCIDCLLPAPDEASDTEEETGVALDFPRLAQTLMDARFI